MIAIALVLLLVVFLINSINGRTDLMARVYGEPVLFFAAALAGSFSVVVVSLLLSDSGLFYRYVGKVLETAGKASLYVFVAHTPIFYCLASVGAILWGFWIYFTFETYWYLLFILGLVVPISAQVLVTFIKRQAT